MRASGPLCDPRLPCDPWLPLWFPGPLCSLIGPYCGVRSHCGPQAPCGPRDPLWSPGPIRIPRPCYGPWALLWSPGPIVVPGLYQGPWAPLWSSVYTPCGPSVTNISILNCPLNKFIVVPQQSSDHTLNKKSWNPWILVKHCSGFDTAHRESEGRYI